MYSNGNGAWDPRGFVPASPELCFYEEQRFCPPPAAAHPQQQFDGKRPRLAAVNPYISPTALDPQFLSRNEHCVNFNSPFAQLSPVQGPIAYTPPLPESPTPHHVFDNHPPAQQFDCGRGIQQPPVARQVITAAPYYNLGGCQETLFAPCQNVQPWTYAYCYGYINQQPCQFAEFVDIEDFMSNEKRKEKSRDAARCRRSRETEIFTELAQVLPLPKEDVDQLDKASVMRVAIAFLKIREMLQLFPKIKDIPDESLDDSEDEGSEADKKESKLIDLWKTAETHKLLTQTLDGFLLILSNDGDVTYVSENITEYLGIAKIDILGQQIWEYTHQCEHGELKEALNIKKNGLTEKVKDENLIEEGITTDHRDLFIRLKCTLTSRGRSVNIKSATYKVIHITGHLVVNTKGDRVLIAVGRPIPHPSNIEIPLGTTTFLTKHSLDMKFTYVDDKMTGLFGYKPEDLLDKSLYECHHGGDTDSLMATFKGVHTKGQGETCRYRFLGKCGGYCWIVTQATLVYDKQKPQSVVCVNYVISNLENNNEIYSLAQYEASQLEKIESNANASNLPSTQPQQQQQQQSIELTETKPKPQPITPHTVAIKQQQDQQQNDQQAVDLESDLLPSELPKKKCVDVDEKQATSAVVDLQQLKRENPNSNQSISLTTTNSIAPTPIADHINKKHIPSVTSFRSIQHHQELLRRNQLSKSSLSTLPPKFIEEKRPKSVTASVFRLTNEKPTVTGSAVSLSQNIGHNSILLNQSTNLPQLNVAPHAQSVTASVFTPISQLRPSTSSLQTSQPPKNLTQSNQQQQQQQQQQTSSVSRSVEMNKGYLSYVEDATALTMLKEEPDDLTHLAPTGVDACLPLDEATPLFQEIMSGLLSYGSLLPDDINSLDSQNSANQTTGSANNKGHIDPFINYRDESNDTNCSQHLLSPSITSKSPEASSLPSLCSPNSLSQEDDFPFMTMNVDDEMELSMRAPYIPMNEQEDLPLLTDDLIWGVAFNSDDLGIQKDDPMQYNTLKQVNLSTNNRMLGNNTNGSCITPDLTISSPSASPMSMSSSSAASSPSPCSSHSSLSMHNQQARSFGGAMLCNSNGGGGGGDGSAGGGNSSLNVDDSDSGISSINSMSPQHTHHHHSSHNQHQQQHQQQQQQQQQHHQQQQHQQHHSPMSIGSDGGLGMMTCKKEIDGAHLCDSIDAFESVYTKDSSNLDCWTVPEFLNINSDDSSVAVDDMQQTHKQQNLIMNTTTLPTNTLHVPLITIQNNKTISMSLQRTASSSPLSSGTIAAGTIHNISSSSTSSSVASAAATVATSSITASSPQQSTGTTSLSSATSNCHNNSNSNKQCGGGSLILSEEIIQNNRKLSVKLPTNSTAATIRISNGNMNTGRHQQSTPKAAILQATSFTTLQGNNKRHLTSGGASSLESKRLKNSSTVEIQTSPHLLQQLMAPAPQKQRVVVKMAGGYDKSQTASRWTKENGGGKGGLQQQQLLRNQHQDSNMNQHHNQSMSSSSASSNSVLKNLLISGCDAMHMKTGPEIMITDEISNDSIAQLSPCDSFASNSSETSTAKVMRNYRSNPMIGGPGFLPSPTFSSDDSNPPGLLTMGDTDSSSDSGIDESCTPNKSLLKDVNNIPDGSSKFYAKLNALNEAVKTGDVFISNADHCANSATIQILGSTTAAPTTAAAAAHKLHPTTSRNNRRKSSLPYIDPEYPPMTTLLMELCNDDYNMNESDYMEHNELVQVLNELSNDMVLSDDSI